MKALATLLLTLTVLSGCLSAIFGDDEPTFSDPLSAYGFEATGRPDEALSAKDIDWPDFSGAALRILDHGAFPGFEDASALFSELTNATVEQTEASDTGTALQQVILAKGDPEFDILYGVDNALLRKAIDEGVLRPYTPQLADRIDPELVFFAPYDGAWPATPVDHGYIALNVDSEDIEDDINTLHDVRRNAGLFVTQDPRTSTPGLGFFLTTVGRFGDTGSYTWEDYWIDLFVGADGEQDSGDEVLVVSDWSTAYEIHFSGGYGIYSEGHLGDRPVVTSYTESPAYEAYYESEDIADVLLDPSGSVFHQIQTMMVLNGTQNRAIAEAWIEFTLTDEFQEMAAPMNAVYPVVPIIDVEPVYGGLDPIPTSRELVELDYRTIGANHEAWIDRWVELCEEHDCL